MAPVPALQTRPLPPVEDRDESDEELFEQLRAGDEAAFRTLVARHRPWLVRLGTRLLGNDVHAAEDLAQESLLKLHAAARRDGRPVRVRPWLAVVARNGSLDEHRRRRPELPGDLPEAPAANDGMFMIDPPLSRAWSTLGGRHREVLYLRELMGMSYREVATVMGLSHSAVETLLFRARAALRREYERAGGSRFGCGVLGLGLYRFATGGRQAGAGAHVTGCEACNRAVEAFSGFGQSSTDAVLSTAGGGWPPRPSPSGSAPTGPAGGGLNLAGGADLTSVPSSLWTSLAQSEPLLAKVLSAGAAMAATLIPAVLTGSLVISPADPAPRPPAASAPAAAPADPVPEQPAPAPTGSGSAASAAGPVSPDHGAAATPAAVTIPAAPAEDETAGLEAATPDPDPPEHIDDGDALREPHLDAAALAPTPPRDSIPGPLATRPTLRDRLRTAGPLAPFPALAPQPVRDPTGRERLAGILSRLAPEVPLPGPAVVPAAGVPTGSRPEGEDSHEGEDSSEPDAVPTAAEERPAPPPYLRWWRWAPDGIPTIDLLEE